MSQHGQVSVVIAAYNQGPFLAEAVASAHAQTYGRPQVIVVDDGSTDDTAAVAAALDVEYVHRKNGGPSAARNTGLAKATGEFVVFLDADDKLRSDHNALCLAALRAHPEASYAYTQWQCFGASDEVSTHPPFDRAELMYRNYINAASLMPKALFTQVRWDKRLRWGMEDWDLYLTLLARDCTGVLVDEPVLLYRQRDVGRTATLRRQSMRLHSVHIYLIVKHWRLYGAGGAWRRFVMVWGWIRQDALRIFNER